MPTDSIRSRQRSRVAAAAPIALSAVLVLACGGDSGGTTDGTDAEASATAAATPDSACRSLTAVPADSMSATGSGLRYLQLAEGSGASASPGDTVVVHYTGCLTDGTLFDASRDRGQPFSFVLGTGQVIAGWDEGLEGMKPGGERILRIPPELGYGSSGGGPIPPDATLLFRVELMEVAGGGGEGSGG